MELQGKTVHLMRHGTTEMNTFLRKMPYGSRGFKDPMFYDTRLTAEGAEGARRAAAITKSLKPQPDVLVVSPLTRALATATLAWPHYEGPVVVEALARERVWLSSDCGRAPGELQEDFKDSRLQLDFSHLPDVWWWTNGTMDPKHVSLEPEDSFKQRVEEFKAYLLDRPEAIIGVVAHWGLLHELTGGTDFANCELRTFNLAPTGQVREIKMASKRFW